jgi:hypothetical protein
VLRSWENQAAYSAQQAQIDYAAQAAVLEVRAVLHPGDGRPGPSDLYSDSRGRVLDPGENFWRGFQFHITQDHVVEPKEILG